MFTGIVQGRAQVESIDDRAGLRSIRLAFAPGFGAGLAVGASVAVDGVCLTAAALHGEVAATFDVMQQTLALTTLGALAPGRAVNVERAARDGAEIGGHPLSGHVDFRASVAEVRTPDNNRVLRLAVPAPWMRYVFAKGYIALAGASLTVAEAQRGADGSGWFEVWLIPETLRATTFGALAPGDAVNVEIDRATQVIVETVRDAVAEKLGPLLPLVEAALRRQGVGLMSLVAALALAAPPAARAADTAQIVSTVCAPCHGEDGNNAATTIPKLAGLQADYLRKQLMDFRTGKRRNDAMAPAMAQIGEGDIPGLADHYARQKPQPAAVSDEKLAAAGKAVYDDGNVDSGVPACLGCHMAGAKGNPRYPRLAGQHAAYTLAQMALYKTGARNNDRAHAMRSVAERMTDEEMAAVAEYLAGLP